MSSNVLNRSEYGYIEIKQEGHDPKFLIATTGPRGAKGDTGADSFVVGPKGDTGNKGERGESFAIDALGGTAGRNQYDSMPDEFSYLDTEAGLLYFRTGSSGWATGIPFGRGEKGEQGIQGEIGLTGADSVVPGPIGLKGDKGDQGDKGIQGDQGIQGIEGPVGPEGERGFTGFKGEDSTVEGPKGEQGPRGYRGDIGDRGPIGVTGETGLKGDTGDIGPRGSTGPTGLTGLTGDRGEQGIRGSQGSIGPDGPTGERGPRGYIGEQGPIGIKGEQGQRGIQGETGLKGDKGDTGPESTVAGPRGDKGTQGEQGIPGDKGDTGDAGIDGTSFTVDDTGPASDRANHNNEPEGFAYLDTDDGNLYIRQGTSGWSLPIPFGKGEKGDQGEKGDKGDTGANSTVEGPRGFKGDQGNPGSTGPASIIPGPKGDIGDIGPRGEKGDPGASSYFHAVENGFIGSESAWLDSLVGEQGPKGDRGAEGPSGPGSGDMTASAYDPQGIGENIYDRQYHTGAQEISTITGLQPALNNKATYVQGAKADTALQARDPINSLDETATGKILTDDERTKLSGISTGATNNATNSQLRDRSTHTGTQLANTVSDFQTAVSLNNDVVANALKAPNATHTGDVTGSTSLTISSKAVTNAKMADVPTNSIKGRSGAGGVPRDLPKADVLSIINVADGATKNSTDSRLRDRGTHTGTQAHTSITGLGSMATRNINEFVAPGDISGALTKLDGIAVEATKNLSDSALRNRADHTGSQLSSTISDFSNAVSTHSAVSANTAKTSNATHTGDVTGSGALSIAAKAVTNSKLDDVPTQTFKGRTASGTGSPTNLSAGQAREILNVEDGATANSTDASLLARGNHTGSQSVSTISGLGTAATTNVGDYATNAQGLLAGTALQTGDVLTELVETSTAKIFTGTERTKLSGIAPAATSNSTDAQLRARSSHTGNQPHTTITGLGTSATKDSTAYATSTQGSKADSATQPGDEISSLIETTGSKIMTAAERTKLSGVATAATKNTSDSQLRDRGTHTGTQAYTSITGLGSAATTSSASYATAAQGGKADTALQSASAFATAAQGTKADTALQSGANISLLSETSVAKILTSAERTKLSGVDTGATKNSTDAQLRARGSHTGNMPAANVSGLGNSATTMETTSTGDPTGGSNGDKWYKVE